MNKCIAQFYLSLENSLCGDYVTEKLWKVLGYNVIPVVLNGANMSNIAPPNSYIGFDDFSSIEGKPGVNYSSVPKACMFNRFSQISETSVGRRQIIYILLLVEGLLYNKYIKAKL